jgi:hypothetical protein
MVGYDAFNFFHKVLDCCASNPPYWTDTANGSALALFYDSGEIKLFICRLGGAERNPTPNDYNHVFDVGLPSSTQPTHNQRFCFLSGQSNIRALDLSPRRR